MEPEGHKEIEKALRPYLPLIAAAAEEARRRTRRQFFPYLLAVAVLALLAGWLVGSHLAEPTPASTPLPSAEMNLCQSAETSLPTITPAPLVVYVSGAVQHPHGVYTLPTGSLVRDAIQAAGGPTDDADLDAINLAKPLYPYEQVLVPTRTAPPSAPATASAALLLDLNRATEAELEQLPGIGPSRAQDIVAYRESHGPFASVEDIQQVPGIGPTTYERIAPYLIVGTPQP